MATDLYQVTVHERSGASLSLRLAPLEARLVPYGPSFAAMLLEEAGGDALKAWRERVWEVDDDFDIQPAIRRIAARDVDETTRELTIEVDLPELLSFIPSGHRWGSAAYDEHGDDLFFHGGEEQVWERHGPPVVLPELPPPPPRIHWAITAHEPPVVVVTARTALLDLPGVDPRFWAGLLRPVFAPLQDLFEVRDDLAAHLRRFGTVRAVSLQGSRATELQATYRIEAVAPEVVGYLNTFTWRDGMYSSRAHPSATRAKTPPTSEPGELADYREMLALGQEEGMVGEVLAEALVSTRDVVIAALVDCRSVDDAPLIPLVEIWASCIDDEVREVARVTLEALAPSSVAGAIEALRESEEHDVS